MLGGFVASARWANKVWMGIALGIGGFYFIRYHYYGKWASNWLDTMSKEELQEWAALNKRKAKK